MSDDHDCPLQDAEDAAPDATPAVPTETDSIYTAECRKGFNPPNHG